MEGQLLGVLDGGERSAGLVELRDDQHNCFTIQGRTDYFQE